MVDVTRPELLLAALKGNELACLLALHFAQGPVKVSWIGDVTGLSAHSLTQALDKLLALGLAGHNGLRTNWQTAPSLRNVLLERVKGQPSLGECVADLTASEAENERRALALDPGVNPVSRQEQTGAVSRQEPAVHFPEQAARSGWMVTDSIPDHPRAAIRAADEPANLAAGAEDNDLQVLIPAIGEVEEPANHAAGAEGADFQQPTPAIRGDGGAYKSRSEPAERPVEHPLSANRGDSVPGQSVQAEVKAGGIKNLSPPALTCVSALNPGRSMTELASGILAASALLFGEAVMGPPERYANLDLLLGHLADVYKRRESLRKPARVVYANIKHGILPPEKYRLNALDYLPRDFLEAAGLISCEGSEVDSGGSDPAEELAEVKLQNKADTSHSQYLIKEESLGFMVSEVGQRSAEEAWGMALAALGRMLSREVYTQVVEPLRLSRFERHGCTFEVAARDAEHAAWLEQRLKRTLERALTGACGREARVSIIVEES